MAPKKKQDAPPEPVPESVKLGIGAFIGLALATLWFLTTESYTDKTFRRLHESWGTTQKVDLVQSGGRYGLVARSNTPQGSPIYSIPADRVLDSRTLSETTAGKIIRYDNGSFINELAQERKLSQGAFNIMSFAAHFALERRLGSASPLADMFALLPPSPKTVLDWPRDVVDTCVDKSVSMEREMLEKVINATVEAFEELCGKDDLPEADVCRNKPLTEEEVKWGAVVYLTNNYQDQAVFPGLNFAEFNNERPGLTPQFDKERNVLHLSVNDNIPKGEPITLNYVRGPNLYLATYSEFMKTARGLEVQLQLPQDETIHRVCTGDPSGLQFGVDGKPRPALVNCMSLLVAPEKLRRKMANNWNKYRTPAMLAFAWGNITYAHQVMAQEFDKIDMEACNQIQGPEADAAREYVAFAQKVLKANQKVVQEKMIEKYEAANLPLPSRSDVPQGPEGGEAEADAENPLN